MQERIVYHEDADPESTGFYIVSLDPPDEEGGQELCFDAAGPYETYAQALIIMINNPIPEDGR